MGGTNWRKCAIFKGEHWNWFAFLYEDFPRCARGLYHLMEKWCGRFGFKTKKKMWTIWRKVPIFIEENKFDLSLYINTRQHRRSLGQGEGFVCANAGKAGRGRVTSWWTFRKCSPAELSENYHPTDPPPTLASRAVWRLSSQAPTYLCFCCRRKLRKPALPAKRNSQRSLWKMRFTTLLVVNLFWYLIGI